MRVVQIFNDEFVVMSAVDVHEDRLDGRLALYEHAFAASAIEWMHRFHDTRLPRTALTIFATYTR